MSEIVKRFEKHFPELFWHIAKGRLSVDEPIYGATINTTGGTEIGAGESNVSVEDAFEIAFRMSGLEWPEQDDAITSEHAELIEVIKSLLKKHEAYHNSLEHAAARALVARGVTTP